MESVFNLGVVMFMRYAFSDVADRIIDSARRLDSIIAGTSTRVTAGLERMQKGFVALTVGLAALTAAAVPVKYVMQYETAMAKVSTLMNFDDLQAKGVNPNDYLKELGSQLTDMSLKYGGTPVEQAGALYETMSAGIDNAADAATVLNAANKVAVGGFADLNSVIGGTTALINSYSMQAADASKIGDLMFQSAALS